MLKRGKKDLEARRLTDSNLVIYNSDGTFKGACVEGRWIKKPKTLEEKKSPNIGKNLPRI